MPCLTLSGHRSSSLTFDRMLLLERGIYAWIPKPLVWLCSLVVLLQPTSFGPAV